MILEFRLMEALAASKIFLFLMHHNPQEAMMKISMKKGSRMWDRVFSIVSKISAPTFASSQLQMGRRKIGWAGEK